MSNVVPQKYRQTIIERFRVRFALVGCLVAVTGALVASASLLPALISVRSAESALAEKALELSTQAKDDQAKQTRTQALILALNPIAQASTSPSTVLGDALALKPSGISITSISYAKGQITLTGVAEDREGVSDFRDALQGSGMFKSVTVPVAALVGVQEGRFTITLAGNF